MGIKNFLPSFGLQIFSFNVWWLIPAVLFHGSLGIAVECSFKVTKGEHKSGPAVKETQFDEIDSDKCPDSMSQGSAHAARLAVALQFPGSQR